ncbi:MAG: IclR family transcriptional regulator [Gammaproteobacteria bacterium]|nr:IclR family transcriptional regulator [Gammaproteobacteria bacterium]
MADGKKRETRNGIQVIARAAAVLRVLKANQSGMSLGQIAEKIELPRSTIQRIVGALQEERLVIATSTGGGIRLGPELHSLGAAARYNIVDQCRPYLNKIVEMAGETVDLSRLSNGRMIFLDQVQGSERLRTVSSVGEVFPMTITANGRACLALLPREKAIKLAKTEWDQLGIEGDIDALMNILAEINQTGLAFDLDDHTDGISAIGFAFRDVIGDLHAISVPIPSTRYERKRDIVIKALTTIRPEITKVLEN